MKSTVSEKPCEEEIKYPCLMKGEMSGRVVLFTHENTDDICGFIVAIGEPEDKIGGDIFADKRLHRYKPYHGSVCLEN